MSLGAVCWQLLYAMSQSEADSLTGTESNKPRSVLDGDALIDSYTWHSDDLPPPSADEDDGLRVPDKDEDWIMGVDEAGRGPVLGKIGSPRSADPALSSTEGPMVYGVAFAPKSFEKKLNTLEFAGQWRRKSACSDLSRKL